MPDYQRWQLRSFRYLWDLLHVAAALRATGVVGEPEFVDLLRAVGGKLRCVCARCATHFEERIDALAALPPEGAEQAMFRLHASFPTTSSPSLAAVVTLYRRKAGALVSALLRRSVHSCPLASISTMSNTLSSPEHAT